MADGEMNDGIYVTRREFSSYQRETDRAIAELAKAQATDAAALRHLPADLRDLAAAVRGLENAARAPQPQAVPSELLSLVAGVHRGVEAMGKKSGGGWTGPAFGACVPTIGFLLWQLFK